MTYFCCNDERLQAVRAFNEKNKQSGDPRRLNGIDFIEVLDSPAIDPVQRRSSFYVHLIKPLPGPFEVTRLHLAGGERLRNPSVKGVTTQQGGRVLEVELESPGDF